MPTRRSFIGALVATPVAAAILPAVTKKLEANAAPKTEWYLHKPYFLPIGCDLSFNSLQWAIDIAKEKKLGKPKFLLIGPEYKFVARELLGVLSRKPYTADSEINVLWDNWFPFEVTRALPCRTWKLVFERGVVISEGPY